jgi:subtilisin family serine protease
MQKVLGVAVVAFLSLAVGCGAKGVTSVSQSQTEGEGLPTLPQTPDTPLDPDQQSCQAQYRFNDLSVNVQSRASEVDDIFEEPIFTDASENRLMFAAEGQHYSRLIVHASQAWAISQGGPGVTVALVDSGLEITHPDLQENLWTDEKGNHGWDFVLNRPVSIDGTGHGTHCAGNVAAAKNGFGVIGVAPKVKVMPVRFIGSNGSGSTANAIRAIYYAVDHGARVISNSWGGNTSVNLCLKKAIDFAIARGVYVVASASNSGKNLDQSPSYPASYPGVIAVGNSNASDEKAGSSGYGVKSVFMFAPGTEILSTTTAARGYYREATGTSMSAPQVAGAIALALSIKPNITREVLLRELCESSTQVLKSYSKCGRLDLGEFIRRVSQL